MARLVKSFIGGIAFKVTGGEVYESEEEETLTIKPNDTQEEPHNNDILLVNKEEQANSSTVNSVVDRKSYSTDEEEEEHDDDMFLMQRPSCKMGTLTKWTNYLSGWQERYVVVRDGILSYYKSEIDLQYGCRGSISLHKVKIFIHEFDELRFDIRAHDCTYFFRASVPEEKNTWVEIIEANRIYILENGPKSSITRQASIVSLSGLSQASTSSFKTGHDLQVKLAEMETYRDILCKQIDVLQVFYDRGIENSSNEVINSTDSIDEIPESGEVKGQLYTDGEVKGQYNGKPSPLIQSSDNSPVVMRVGGERREGHRRTGSDPFSFRQTPTTTRSPHLRHTTTGSHIDFRGEAITFKATTAGILSSMKYCIDIMNKREDYWQKKFEKEQDRRRKAERAAHSAMNGPRVRAYEYAGPDFEEGPHSALNEDEFFDALEMAYREDEIETNNNSMTNNSSTVKTVERRNSADSVIDIQHQPLTGIEHKLTPLVNDHVSKYAKYIYEPVESNDGSWQLAHEDGDMKVYRRELEEDGVVVDPLKAQHIVKGLSGFEMCKYFFDKDTRMDWEGTIESFKVLETLAEDTVIFHQLHKRVWPSTQRDTVFCSHMCSLINAPNNDCTNNSVGRTWMVCNFSMDHPSVPVTSKMIRATLNVGLVCTTITHKPIETGKECELTRDDVSCKIIYAANVNPGGWAPPSVVRTIAKREITKFLKKISGCAQKAILQQPLTL